MVRFGVAAKASSDGATANKIKAEDVVSRIVESVPKFRQGSFEELAEQKRKVRHVAILNPCRRTTGGVAPGSPAIEVG